MYRTQSAEMKKKKEKKKSINVDLQQYVLVLKE